MKFLLSLILFSFTLATPIFAQKDFANDTIIYKPGVYEYNIDFFGLERTLNWDTINQHAGIGQVVLNFHNHTLAPIEMKKAKDDNGIITWNFPKDEVIIPPNGHYILTTNFNFVKGDFRANLKLTFKHLRKKHELKFQTFGFAEEINSLNADGNKHGRWLDYNDAGQLKHLQGYQDGRLFQDIEYYYNPTGGVRLKMDRIKLVDTYYDESGVKQFEMRPDSRTDFYESGIIKSVETEKKIIRNDENGNEFNSRSQERSKVLDDYEMLVKADYHPNGYIKMQTFSNHKEMHYSNKIEGCLTKRIENHQRINEVTFEYENCRIVATSTPKKNNGRLRAYSISRGTFENEKLIDGEIVYYDNTHKIRFTEEIKNGNPTEAIWLDGIKYNEKNASGGKHGLWVSNRPGWGRWTSSNDNEILVKGYFENGEPRDTVFYYYPGGKIKEISVKTTDIKSASTISYYTSGNVSDKTYSFYQSNQSKVYKRENYADSPTLNLSSARMNGFYYVYKNGRIISRKSSPINVDNSQQLPSKNRRQYTVATGSFRKEHLYNGKITYYNDNEEALRTVRVSEGRISGDRIVIFEDLALEMELCKAGSLLDRDRNGYITRSEIRNVKKLEIRGSWIESVADLKSFSRLKELFVNGRKVETALLKQPVELLIDVKRLALLSPVSKGGGRWGGGGDIWPPYPVPEPPGPPEPIEPIIYDFVEVEPEFPGGVEAFMEFLATNLIYPELDSVMGTQGTVYARFVVNENGFIEQVRIVKGVSPSLDKEAIRIIKLMPKWKPGEQAGKKVSVRYTLPIKFRL